MFFYLLSYRWFEDFKCHGKPLDAGRTGSVSVQSLRGELCTAEDEFWLLMKVNLNIVAHGLIQLKTLASLVWCFRPAFYFRILTIWSS